MIGIPVLGLFNPEIEVGCHTPNPDELKPERGEAPTPEDRVIAHTNSPGPLLTPEEEQTNMLSSPPIRRFQKLHCSNLAGLHV